MKKEFIISVDEDLLRKLDIAVKLRKEDKEEVLTECIKQYIIKTFKAEANLMMNDEITNRSVSADPSDSNYGKALNRIAKWATSPHQINNRIMKAFFLLETEGKARKLRMEDLCKDPNGDVYVRDFNNNFNSMCTDAGNSHGKVFEVDNEGYVYLWSEIKDFAMKYKEEFMKERKTDIGLTDQIREYITQLLNNASEEGMDTLDVRSGTIHKEMGLDNRMPSVCGAMETIDRYKNYEVLSDTPSGKSSTRVFRYKLRN